MAVSIEKSKLLDYLSQHDFAFFADTPIIYHGHHYNLFLDQTIDDGLGVKDGSALRTRAAREAFFHFFTSLVKKTNAHTPQERLFVASTLFAAMGQGSLEILGDQYGGTARGRFLHYGFSWADKYSKQVRRRHPADAVAAGAAAAALEVAYNLPQESIASDETACITMQAPACSFQLSSALVPPLPFPDPVAKDAAKRSIRPSFTGLYEDEILKRAHALRSFVETVSSDERGLIQSFGVFLTMHLPAYSNRISYDALYQISKTSPQSFSVMEALLREAGHFCGFHTFGGILHSPEWEGLFGRPSGEVEDIAISSCAIGRALGFGRWCIHEIVPQKRFVLRTPSSYEATFHLARHPRPSSGRCYLLQGAATAIMLLAHRVDWKGKPSFSQDFYSSLFRGPLPWKSQETSCLSKGDNFCEVVVEAR